MSVSVASQRTQPVHINDLGNELFDILSKITAFRDKSQRDVLLLNWPVEAPLLSLSRADAAMADLSYMIDGAASWGRLENGEWALAVLAKKALLFVKETDRGRELEAWLSKLEALPSDAQYNQPPLGRWSKAMPRLIRRAWLIWLSLIVGLGFILPPLWPTAIALNELTRYLAAGLFITLTLTIIGIRLDLIIMPFRWWVRTIEVSIYGPTMGFVLGVTNSVLWLRSCYFVYTNLEAMCLQEWSLGQVGAEDYMSLIMLALILSFVLTVSIFFVLPVFGKLALDMNYRYTTGIFIGYSLLTVMLLLLGLTLPYGWLAAIGAMETPSYCPA